MTPMETIERFAEHVGFDINRTEFTFTADETGGFYSRTYEMDRALRRIPEINECDPTGRLALVYLKRQFERDLQSQKVRLFDVISSPSTVRGDAEMWRELCSPEVSAIEGGLSALMSHVTEEATGRKLLGDTRTAKQVVADSVERVVDGMRKCRLHIWLADGSPIRRPASLPAAVVAFESVAEALSAVSRMPDGMCLAYVRQERSTDGFFAIFVKSAGNVVSYDDMLCEEYPGQHGRFRNGRYLEGKSFDFFPYGSMVAFSGSDCKGYATEASVAGAAFPLSELEEADCIALVLAMSCYAELVDGLVPDAASRMHVTSLSPASLSLTGGPSASLALRSDDALAIANDTSPFTDISDADALSARGWSPAARNDGKKPPCGICKRNALSILDGSFALDRSSLLGNPGSEWVADEKRMHSVAMLNARKQVARAFMEAMRDEFEAWGGIDRLRAWWAGQVSAHRDRIVAMCARDWRRRKEEDDWPESLPTFFAWGYRNRDGEPGMRNLRLGKADGWCHSTGRTVTLNDVGRDSRGGWCMLDAHGNRCTIAYLFAPWDFSDIAAIADTEGVPLVVRLYTRSDEMFGYAGNDILDVCDPVDFLKNPLRGYTWAGYREQARDESNCFNFTFQIGFTRRELNSLAKALADDEEA